MKFIKALINKCSKALKASTELVNPKRATYKTKVIYQNDTLTTVHIIRNDGLRMSCVRIKGYGGLIIFETVILDGEEGKIFEETMERHISLEAMSKYAQAFGEGYTFTGDSWKNMRLS